MARVFMLTGFSEQSKAKLDLIKKIHELDGKYIDSMILLPCCTHLIAHIPSRSEKFLCACASGRWILHPKYIMESYEMGEWLNEEDYEWNEESFEARICPLSFAFLAPRRCRLWVARHKKGLLASWKVVLFLGSIERAQVCERIVVFGGGRVYCRQEYVKPEVLKRVTHMFVDEGCQKTATRFLKLVKCHVLHPDFLRNYILKEGSVKPEDFSVYRYKANSDDFKNISQEHFCNCSTCKRFLIIMHKPPQVRDNMNHELVVKTADPKPLSRPIRRGSSKAKGKVRREKRERKQPETPFTSDIPSAKQIKTDSHMCDLLTSPTVVLVDVLKTNKLYCDPENLAKDKTDFKKKSSLQREICLDKPDYGGTNKLCHGPENPAKDKANLKKDSSFQKEICLNKPDSVSVDRPQKLQQYKITDCFQDWSISVKRKAMSNNSTPRDPNMCVIDEHLNSYHGLPEFYSIFTSYQEEVVISRLPTSLYMIIESHFEEEASLCGLQALCSLIGHRQFPSPEMLGEILYEVFRQGDFLCIDKALSLLESLARVFPPFDSQRRDYYIKMVQLLATERDTLWNVLKELISQTLVVTEDSTTYSCSISLLHWLCNLLELDFLYFLKSSKSVMEGINSLDHCPLIVQFMWRNGQVGVINRSVSELFGLMSQHLCTKFNSRRMTAFQKLLGLVAECCRCGYKLDHPQTCSKNELITSFVRSLIRTLSGSLKDIKVLNDFLTSIKHHWLTLIISDHLLNLELEKRDADKAQKSIKFMSLRKILHCYIKLTEYKEKMGKSVTLRSLLDDETSESLTKDDGNTRGAGVNKRNSKGETKLHRACMRNDVASLKKQLLMPGIDVNAIDNLGVTPLHEAAVRGHTDCVRELLEWKSVDGRSPLDLSPVAYDGITPLHDAVINDHLQVTELLLKHGGKQILRYRMVDGSTAEQLATSQKMKDLISKYSGQSQNLSSTNIPSNMKNDENSIIFTNPYDSLRHMILLRSVLSAYSQVFGLRHLMNTLQRSISSGSTSKVNEVKRTLTHQLQRELSIDELVTSCDDMTLLRLVAPASIELRSQVPSTPGQLPDEENVLATDLLLRTVECLFN